MRATPSRRFDFIDGTEGAGDPRLVEHDIEPPELLDRASNRRLDIRLAGNVGALKNRAPARRSAFGHRQLATLRVQVSQNDRRAFLSKPNRRSPSHPASRARDNRNLILDSAHSYSPAR